MNLPYDKVMHGLTMIEMHCRTAREGLAASAQIQAEAGKPKIALAGERPDPTPGQMQQIAQKMMNEAGANIMGAIHMAKRLEETVAGGAAQAPEAAKPGKEPAAPEPLTLAQA